MMRNWVFAAMLLGMVGCANYGARREAFYAQNDTPVGMRSVIDRGDMVAGMTFREAMLSAKSFGSPLGFNGNPAVRDGTVAAGDIVLAVWKIPNLRLRMFFYDGRLVSFTQH